MERGMCCSRGRLCKGVHEVVRGSCMEGQIEVCFYKVCVLVANTNIT